MMTEPRQAGLVRYVEADLCSQGQGAYDAVPSVAERAHGQPRLTGGFALHCPLIAYFCVSLHLHNMIPPMCAQAELWTWVVSVYGDQSAGRLSDNEVTRRPILCMMAFLVSRNLSAVMLLCLIGLSREEHWLVSCY
jgi:hypothetical protein